jgi:hypothetical protein
MRLRIFAAVLIALSGPAIAQEPPKAPAAAEANEPAKPTAEAKEAAKAAEPERVLSVEKSTKPPECVIKPVMSDDELRACGARIPK